MSAFRPLKFTRVPHPLMNQPCIVPSSHKAHSSGYVYLLPRHVEGGKLQRLHRLVWLSRYGPDSIPPRHELDHICGNRACCNPKHLRVLERTDHIRITARAARIERMEKVWGIWEREGRPGCAALARLIGGSSATTSRWIREWKAEDEELAAWKKEVEALAV